MVQKYERCARPSRQIYQSEPDCQFGIPDTEFVVYYHSPKTNREPLVLFQEARWS